METTNGADFDDEIDLRAEDDALIAAELDAAEAASRTKPRRGRRHRLRYDESDEDAKPRRRRGRRGGRRRSAVVATPAPSRARSTTARRATGLWLDPGVVDDPVYAEHWAGHRPVEVTIEEDKIVIRRAGTADDE